MVKPKLKRRAGRSIPAGLDRRPGALIDQLILALEFQQASSAVLFGLVDGLLEDAKRRAATAGNALLSEPATKRGRARG